MHPLPPELPQERKVLLGFHTSSVIPSRCHVYEGRSFWLPQTAYTFVFLAKEGGGRARMRGGRAWRLCIS